MKDVGSGMGVKNISDLVLKNPTKNKVMNIK